MDYSSENIITKNYILAYKLGASIISGLFTVSFFFLTKNLMKINKIKCDHKNLIPYIICSFFIFSPTLTYFSLQFPKNLFGFFFLNLFIIFLLQFFISINNIKISSLNILLTIIFFFGAFFTHRFSAALSLIIISLTFFYFIIKFKKLL